MRDLDINWTHKYIIRIRYQNELGGWEQTDRDSLYLGNFGYGNLAYYAFAAYGAVAGCVGDKYFKDPINKEAVRKAVEAVIGDTGGDVCPLYCSSIRTAFNKTHTGGNPVIWVRLRNTNFDKESP